MVSSKSLYRKYHNNEPPTNEETIIAQKKLQSTSCKAKILEDQVHHLQFRLNNLTREKKELSTFIASHRDFISPIRRLVPEILQEIFYHCLPTAHNALMSNKTAPLALSRVCRQWREIAFCTSRLWTSIHIVAMPSVSLKHHLDVARREAITAWLSRSGALPLSISMSFRSVEHYWCSRSPPLNRMVQPYIDLILRFASRWKYVYFNLPRFCWKDLLVELNGSQFPLLESLHIQGNWFPRRRNSNFVPEVPPLERENSIVAAPSLRVISLPTYFPRLLQLWIPWNKITGINLGAFSLPLEEIYKVLTLCASNLEMCSVLVKQSIPQDHDNDDAAQIVQAVYMNQLTLEKLRSFEIIVKTDWNSGTCTLLERINTPALRHLTYDRGGFGGTEWGSPMLHESGNAPSLNSLCSFLGRLTFPLEELDLKIVPFCAIWAKEVLPLVPSLKRLSLKGYNPPITLSEAPRSPSVMYPGLSISDLLSYLIPNCQTSDPESMDQLDNEDDYTSLLPTPSPFPPSAFATTPLRCFCPKLEVLHCTDAGFSFWHILKFLYSRTVEHQKHGVTHLRRVSVPVNTETGLPWGLDEKLLADFESKIEWLGKETGILVDVRYQDLNSRFKRHRGIDRRFRDSKSESERSSRAYQGLPVEYVPRQDGQWVYFGF